MTDQPVPTPRKIVVWKCKNDHIQRAAGKCTCGAPLVESEASLDQMFSFVATCQACLLADAMKMCPVCINLPGRITSTLSWYYAIVVVAPEYTLSVINHDQ